MPRDAKPIVIAVLSGNEDEKKAITETKSALGADFIFASSMHHLRDVLIERPCNGVLFCLTSLMGIDQSSKSFVQSVEQVYPVARIRWNKEKGAFSLIASRSGQVESLPDFVTICSNFAPRRARRSERLVKTLNVLISAAPELTDATPAFTMNISTRGCFIHTSRGWNTGESVYLRILELPGRRAIEGKVIRCVQWGVPFCAQGIGVQFVNIENELVEELHRLLYYLPGKHPEKVTS